MMGIPRPKAQIQQPASYFARSESYTGCHIAPSQLITPLTTPPVDLSLSQPSFPTVSPSPCQSDGWPSPQSSTSSRVDFSLSYSPSPSPSPSPSGPFQSSSELVNQGDNRMDLSQSRTVSISTSRHSGQNQTKGNGFSSDRSLDFNQGKPMEFWDSRGLDFRHETQMDCSQGNSDFSQIKRVSFSQGRNDEGTMDYSQGNVPTTAFGVYSKDRGLDLNRSTRSQNNGLAVEGSCHSNPFLSSPSVPAEMANSNLESSHVPQPTNSNPFTSNPFNPFSQY